MVSVYKNDIDRKNVETVKKMVPKENNFTIS